MLIKVTAPATLLLMLIACVTYTFFVPHGISGIGYVFVTPVAVGFYLTGFLFKKFKILGVRMLLWFGVIAVIAWCILAYRNNVVLMYQKQYEMN